MPDPRPTKIARLSRPAARGAAGYLVARIVGAALLVAQVGVVSAAYAAPVAAAVFVLSTVIWVGAVWLRCGVDQILPRRAAEARISGDGRGIGFGGPLVRRATLLLTVVLPMVLWATVPGAGAGEIAAATGLGLLSAAAWALLAVLAALLRGYDAVGRSGVLQSVLPAAALLAGTVLATVLGDSWLSWLAVTAAALVACVPVAAVATRAVVGPDALRSVLAGRGRDAEQPAAAGVTILGEVGLALPVLLASVLGVDEVELGALYAALRVANVFSWAAAAVAVVAAPRLAMAVAGGGDVARVLRRSSGAAAATSLPLAAVGLVIPGTVLGLFDDGYAASGGILAALVAGRLVDGCAGPLSEALVVGGRVRLELWNMAFFCVVVLGGGLLLEPSMGADGLALAVAVGTASCTLPRIAQVRRALAGPWAASPGAGRTASGADVAVFASGPGAGGDPAAARPAARRGGPSRRAVLLAVAACGLVDLVVALEPGLLPRPAGFFLVVATVPLVVALGLLEARRRDGGSWAGVVAAPIAMTTVSGIMLFAVRPLTLWASPRDSSLALTALGFGRDELTVAAALAALCCAGWTTGYLAALPRPQPLRIPALPPVRPMTAGTLRSGLLAVGIGCALATALFFRQGGFAVLQSSPGELHNDGLSSGYAVLGVWLVQGTAILGLVSWLRGGGRHAAALTTIATLAALLVSISMQARGLLAIGAGAAVLCVVLLRPVSRRTVLVTVAVVAVSLPALTVLQQVRSYSQNRPLGDAVELAVRTPPGTLQISDLSVFDNLVAMQGLVPETAPRLDGSSLVAVPSAFVPRALWPDKPLPVDQQVSALLYPGSTAGSPIGLPGELWWNFGVLGVLLGAPLVGAAMALLVRLRRRIRGPGGLVLLAVATISTVAPLTRAIAPMTTNTAVALVGTLLAAGLVGGHFRAAAARASRRLGPAVGRAVDPWRGAAGDDRAGALDGLRGLSALAVVVTHVGDVVDAPNPSPFTPMTGTWGAAAVAAFFALSGFLLYRPFVAARSSGRPEPDLGHFVLRRLTRVVPGYWMLLTVFGLLAAAPGALGEDWWRYYLLAQVYTDDVSVIVGGISPAWTLDVELSYYLSLAAMALVLRARWRALPVLRRERLELVLPAALLVLGAGVLSFATLEPDAEILRRTLPGTLVSFSFGMLLAVADVRRRDGRPVPRWAEALRRRTGACTVVAVACIAGIAAGSLVPNAGAPVLDPAEILGFLMASQVAAFATVAPVLLGARPDLLLMRFMRAAWLRWCGVGALGIYLSHYPLLTLLVGPVQGIEPLAVRFAVLLAVVGAGAILIGSLSWLLVERPAIEAVSRRLRSRATSDDRDAPVRSPA